MITVVSASSCLHFSGLLPTPIRLRVASVERQLLHFGPVGQHRPDLFAARAARLKNKMASVRRPRWKIIAPAVMGQLHPLLAGDVHQINVVGSRSSRSIFAKPRER